MSDLVTAVQDGPVVTITLNAPERRNPISDPPAVGALVAAVERADAAADVRAVVLTGAGSAFSSGGDLKKMASGEGLRDAQPTGTRAKYKGGIQRLPLLFQAIEVPVIAAVNGPAIGAGCDLACMCDVRIASEKAVFAESFVKVGLIPGDGGAWLLPRIVGFPKACEMALTGDVLSAAEALACGLVTRVVPAEALMEEALAMAGRIAANPRHAVRMTKRLLREAQAAPLANILELSAALQALAHTTADHAEAVDAFVARRPPVFHG